MNLHQTISNNKNSYHQNGCVWLWQPVIIPTTEETIADSTSSDNSLLGSLILSSNDVIGDISTISRSFFTNTHKFYGTHDPRVVDALGATSAFCMLSGGLNVARGLQEIDVAEKSLDVEGKQLGVLKVIQGLIFTIAGAFYIPIRVLSVLALSVTSKLLHGISERLGIFSGILYSLGSFFLLIAVSIRLYTFRTFRKELKKYEDPALAFEYLKKQITLNAEEKKDLKAVVEKKGLLYQEQREKYNDSKKIITIKKEAALKRIIGEQPFDLLKNASSENAEEVVEAVKKSAKKQVIFASLSVGFLSLTLIVTGLSFVFLAPVAVTIIAMVGVGIGFGWLGIDGYDLIQGFKKDEVGCYDKLWILVSSILALVCFTCVFFLAAGLFPIVIASIVGGLWLAINTGAYAHLFHLEKMHANAPKMAQNSGC